MNPDPLKSALQKEAAENAPAFSPLVHARIMATLRAADPATITAAPHSRRWLWTSAAAAMLFAGAFLPFHMLNTKTVTPVAPHPTAVALPSPSELVAPVDNFLAQAALPAEQTFDQGKYAYLDQDAKRFALFLADQLPSAPTPTN